ncbi:MAG: TraE/TraK family type IV conjugative transfer system protein [Gammaproteobacteria bacterium]
MAVTRPSYFEWRAQLEAEAGRWRVSALLLGVACLALIALIVFQASRPAPVYFFAGSRGMAVGGLARADRVPPELVEAFAGQVALVFGNLMPATARQSYDRMRSHMTPTLQRLLAAQAAADLQSIEERRLSTSFTVRDSLVVASTADQWTVRVSGHRLSWSRATLMTEEDISYEFDIVRARPSDANPAGLAIARVHVGRTPEPAQRPTPPTAPDQSS